MGRSTGTITSSLLGSGVRGVGRGGGIIIPVPNAPQAAPKENVGIMSGPMRKPASGQQDSRGASTTSGLMQVTMRDPKSGQMYGGLVKDGEAQFKAPDGSTPSFPKPEEKKEVGETKDPNQALKEYAQKYGKPADESRQVLFDTMPISGPEREVPIQAERPIDISREGKGSSFNVSGEAPFSPDERRMARDRFFERMFSKSDERRQQRNMEREERSNVRDALRSERALRGNERGGRMNRYGEGRMDRYGEGDMSRRGSDMSRRGMPGRPTRRSRRRDFTRRRSRLEGGRRGRSGRELAAFRDRYVSTLGSNFFS